MQCSSRAFFARFSMLSAQLAHTLVITLSWLTLIKPAEHFYQDALLDFRAENENGYPIGVQRVPSSQPPFDTSRRGTVVHEIFEGQDAVPIGDDDVLRIRVECRTQGANALPQIPYAIIITFEVAETLKSDIYSEIQNKLILTSRTQIKG